MNATANSKSFSILIADDDRNSRDALRDIIQPEGFQTIVASSGEEAIDIVRGVMVFDRSKLFIVKPIGRRYWSASASINDADEIGGSILLQAPREGL